MKILDGIPCGSWPEEDLFHVVAQGTVDSVMSGGGWESLYARAGLEVVWMVVFLLVLWA